MQTDNGHNSPTYPSRILRAFENPGYRRLWPSTFLTQITRWMQLTLLSWLILELTNSAWMVALLGFFLGMPLILFGIVGGIFADRINRLSVLRVTHATNLVTACLMTILLLSGLFQIWHAYLAITIAGSGWALDSPSRRSLVRDFIGRSGISNAFALESMGFSCSKMMGPALAGAIISLGGVSSGYIVATVLYILALMVLWPLQLPSRPGVAADAEALISSLLNGVRYVKNHQVLLATLLITVLMNLLAFPYIQMVPVIARDVLQVGPGLMGLLMAAEGLGALIGAITIASLSSIDYHGRIYVAGAMIMLIAVILFSFSGWYAISILTLILIGTGTAGFTTMQSTIIVLQAREDMRGRSLGVLNVTIGANPLGALLVGAIATAASPTLAIMLNASVGIVLLVFLALLLPSILRGTAQPESVQAR